MKIRYPDMYIRYLRESEGSVFILMAATIFTMIMATGVAVDMARAQALSVRMSSALDAAGLAAGATTNTPPSPLPSFCGSTTWVQCEAQRYFNANFPTGYLGSGTVTLNVTQSGVNNSVISLQASTSQSTTFLNVAGIHSVSVSASSQITITTKGMELVLVLDNTGSMNSPVDSQNSSTTKIQALQQAANDLISILYGSNTTVTDLWVGLVPFSQAVNIGKGHTTWVSSSTADFGPAITINGSGNSGSCPTKYNGVSGVYSSPGQCSYTLTPKGKVPNFGSTNWKGCVMARSSPYDISDDVPSSSVSGTMFQVYNFPTNPDAGESNYDAWYSTSNGSNSTTTTYNLSYNSSILDYYGPNELCPQQITQMTANKNTITAGINSMTAAGDTDLDLGMVWGWRLLSPKWQGLWGGEMNNTGNTQFPELPLPYNTALMNKVVVFMTDGMDRFVPGDYSGYGFLGDNQLGSTDELTAESTLDTRLLSLCSSMKSNGIIIYTIGFGNATTDDPPTEDDRGNPLLVDSTLLQSCATQNYTGDTSHFFLAPTNAQLQSAFQQIAGQLSNLRVSQ